MSYINNARLVITDSGGLQEEACILNTPCVTIRENTERPETLKIKSNLLTGYNKRKIRLGILEMINKTEYGSSLTVIMFQKRYFQ